MMRSSSSTGSDNDTDVHKKVSALEMNEIDLERLRQVFGSSSSEDLNHRKPHELRELWLEKNAEATATGDMATTSTTTTPSPTARIPCFLLDPSEEDHIPPHVVALQLLLGRRRMSSLSSRSSISDGLYKPVASSSDDKNDAPRRRRKRGTHPSRRTANTNTNITLQGTVAVWPLILVALIALACQFVLEVLGGAGAIWGTAELFALRTGGSGHPSWHLFTIVASIVGTFCLLRFFLVHPFFAGPTDPTFAEKHKLRDVLRRYKAGTHRGGLYFELATLVARDPVLFLHPTKGLALSSSCCGCYCVCCGNRWPSFGGDGDGGNNDEDDPESGHHYGSCSRSPVSAESLGKPSSIQRNTWDLSDDDDEGADGYGTATDP